VIGVCGKLLADMPQTPHDEQQLSERSAEPSEFERYFQTSEEVGWRTTDLDWGKIDLENVSELDRQTTLGTSIIEHGVPHYAALWQRVAKIEDDWNLRQFAALWAGEEHRHSYCLKRLADSLGIRSSNEYFDIEEAGAFFYDRVARARFVENHSASCASGCYATIPGMLVYTTLQELRTWRYYFGMARETKSAFCKALFMNIAKDEMRHHVFYSNALASRLERAEDRRWFEAMAMEAFVAFKMPHDLYAEPLKIFSRTTMLGPEDQDVVFAAMRRSLGMIEPIAKALNEIESRSERAPRT
jgi:rubrerythrin